MRRAAPKFFVALACAVLGISDAQAKEASAAKGGKAEAKPWCAPEVTELSDHVCFFDGGAAPSGKRTLVIYMHGMLATTPGFQYLQQRAMAIHAKRLGFTVLLPTSPLVPGGYVWPTSQAALKDQEPTIVANVKRARADLEKRVGRKFDETFVVGFSSGAYYASSAAVRGVLDVDGYIVLAGGGSWVRSDDTTTKRAPIFVGISAADRQTAGHSRAFAGTLASLHWPYRAEERNAGHMVDWTFMDHGIGWLRSRASAAP